MACLLAALALAPASACFVEEPPPSNDTGAASSGSATGTPCDQGSLACACFPNGTCSPGLVCDQGVCEVFDPGTTTNPATATSDMDTSTSGSTGGVTTTGLDSSSSDGGSSTGDEPAHILFTLAASFDGAQVQGLAVADTTCTTAGQPLRGGPWVAVLRDVATPLTSRVAITGDVVNSRGEPLAADGDQFFSGTLQNIPGYDETGAAISGSDLAWTGSRAGDCLGWTSAEPVDVGTTGLPSSTELWLDTTVPLPCSGTPHIYCISQ